MDTLTLALDSAAKVLLAGLLIGAGLPAVFALGIRALASRARPAGYLCFAVVVFGVALGITFIVGTGLGRELSFEHVYPTLVSKD